jgi:DASH complex subunit SPC19
MNAFVQTVLPWLILSWLTRPRVRQLFALINESHAAMYKTQLAEEVEPQITELTKRAEKGIKLLERKENVLTSKVSERAHACSVR